MRRAAFQTNGSTGADYRVYTLVSHDGDYVYQVAQPESFRKGMATQAALEALVPTPVLILLVWLAIPLIVRVTFSRLSRAREKAESINLGNLEPLDVRGVPAEVMPFASSVNVMIDRLRVSVESEKQFIADAAHELRTSRSRCSSFRPTTSPMPSTRRRAPNGRRSCAAVSCARPI